MYTRAAYLGVIFIWATTPLAIQWSSEGVGYLFAVTLRMALGVMASCVLLRVLGQSLPRHARALQTYLVSGLSIYLSMSCVYWASQYIPSGWISVVFGLSPIMTGVMAMWILDESTALLPHKLAGMLLGLIGLILVFGQGYHAGQEFVIGITGVFAGVLIHSLSAVLIKLLQAQLSGVAATTGGLVIAAPLFIVTWVLGEGSLPVTLSTRAIAATIYLGVIASAFGFALYYYILNRMEVGRVALITLITPICALILGNLLNHEVISPGVLSGTGFIVAGLLLYEYGRKLSGYLF